MAGKGGKPLAYKDTFWNRLRVEHGVTFKDLANYLHMSQSAVGMYFTGQTTTPDWVVDKLCAYFDVDPIKGAHEFSEAHKNWDAEQRSKNKVIKQETPVAEPITLVVPEIPVLTKEEAETVAEASKQTFSPTSALAPNVKVLRLVYGKADMDVFLEYYEHPTNDPLGFFYGKVDYPVYQDLENALGGKQAATAKAVVTDKPDPWEIP